MTGIMQMFVAGGAGATAPGSQSYTTAGSYTWVAPSGVTSVSIVAVGSGGKGYVGGVICCLGCGCAIFRGGGGGGGGGLVYANNVTVTPGSSYTVGVNQCSKSYFNTASYLFASNGTNNVSYQGAGGGSGGGSLSGRVARTGGSGGFAYSLLNCAGAPGGGGGGAAGYSGNGGNAGICAGCAGAGGGGGGGTRGTCSGGSGTGGGGVGLLGQGSNGAGGGISTPGGGGSGGASGQGILFCSTSNGGSYGGGGSGAAYSKTTCTHTPNGAVRIIWPGATRSFPSTCAGNP